MLPIKETAHVATAQALLIDQFKSKPVIQGYLSALARRVQEVENVLWDIIELRRLDVATGIQLDALGALVGEKRIGRNDTDYRTGIRLRIRVNRSKGRIADVVDVAMLASNVLYPPRVTEYAFLGFEVEIYGQTGERYIADLLSRTRAATSYGVLVASDLAASALLVWDDAVSPVVGIQSVNDAVSPGPLVCASAYGLPSDFSGIVLGAIAPSLSSVSTSGGAVGDINGAYPATLTGSNFTGGTTVTFGGTLATSVVVVNDTTITCVVPAHAAGVVSVLVTTPGGTNTANTAFEYWSPAQLAATLWQRGSYASAPWAGTASAGTSGAASLAAGTAPAVGSPLNGYAPADFNGTTHNLVNAGAFSSFASLAAGTVWTLFRADTAAADVGAGSRIDNKGLVAQNGGSTGFGLGYSTSGVTVAAFDGAAYKEVVQAASATAYHAAFCRWNSTLLELGVDSGAMGTIACSAISGTGTLAVGKNYSSAFFDGQIEEVGMVSAALDDATRSKLRSYLNTRYFPAGAQV